MTKADHLILAFLTLFNSLTYSQVTSTNGSFMIAAICKDGIIIGSDSRLTLKYKNGAIGYIDSIQKIFPGKNYVIGLMGTANVNNYNVSYLTKRFTDSLPQMNEDVSFTWFHWTKYIEKMIPKAKIDLNGMIFFLANYRNSKPNIYYNYRNGTRVLVKRSGFVEPDSTIFGSKYSSKITCKKATKLIKEAIYKYAKDKNKELTIGGPIYFIKISKNNSVKWLKDIPPREFEKLEDFNKEPNRIIRYYNK